MSWSRPRVSGWRPADEEGRPGPASQMGARIKTEANGDNKHEELCKMSPSFMQGFQE